MDTTTNIDDRHGIGGNQPPQTTADDLADRYKDIADRFVELTDTAKTVPNRIEDDAMHAKVVELVKSMRSLEIAAEAKRDEEKAPFKLKVEEIVGWFNSRIMPFADLRKTLNARHKDYSDRKAEAERQRIEKEAEERRAREREALRLASEAQAAVAAADQAASDASALADDAKAAREAATTELETALADLADARAKSGALWAKILEIDAKFANKRKAGESVTTDDIAAEKGDLPEQYKVAKDAVTAADKAVKDARAVAAEAKRQAQEAERKADDEKRQVAQANRQVQAHLGEAVREDKAAKKLEQKAAGPDADLARVRSEHGGLGTVMRQWQSQVIDRDQLDKAALWPFIHPDAISAALHKWMMVQPVHKRVMPGAQMSEETVGVVR